jgi:CBS-domain-containing membrane protein
MRRLQVKEVMTTEVAAFLADDSLAEVIEGLTAQRLGAVLIRNASGDAVGVVSKSDLIVAYKHGTEVEAPAADIMSQPIVSCEEKLDLAPAIQQMLVRDVQRLFVHSGAPTRVTGILSLSDAARFRSGSCRACTSSRLIQK